MRAPRRTPVSAKRSSAVGVSANLARGSEQHRYAKFFDHGRPRFQSLSRRARYVTGTHVLRGFWLVGVNCHRMTHAPAARAARVWLEPGTRRWIRAGRTGTQEVQAQSCLVWRAHRAGRAVPMSVAGGDLCDTGTSGPMPAAVPLGVAPADMALWGRSMSFSGVRGCGPALSSLLVR